MTIGLPETSKEVEDRIKVDVAREAPDSNPYVQNSWLLALVVGFGRRIFDFYRDLKRSEDNTFPDTATGERAEQWGTIYGKTRIPASQAAGNCIATGIANTIIPAATIAVSGDNSYTVDSSSIIAAQSISVDNISRSGTIGSVITAGDHNLSSIVPVTISGATEPEYNVADAAITVTGLRTFTYEVLGSPSTPATGATILVAFTVATVPVTSVEFGAGTNLTLDTPLTLQSPISGANDILGTDYGEIGGGTDQETDAEFKTRYLDRIQNPVAHFSVSDIVSKAKEVAGVTRVFVEEAGTTFDVVNITSINRVGQVATVVTPIAHNLEDHMQVTVTGATETEYNVVDERILVVDATTFIYLVTGTPATPASGGPSATGSIPLGVVRIYFTRDNDVSSIPSASEVIDVNTKLREIRPANTSVNSMLVRAPTAVPVTFVFSILDPNTLTMRDAIAANLAQFFEEGTVVGLDIDEDAYRAVIKNTVDTETGDTVANFDLTVPIADIAIGSGEIGTLGTIIV